MTDDKNIDMDRIHRRVEDNLNKRIEFFIHAGVFAPLNLLVWLLWFGVFGGDGFVWPLVITLGWGRWAYWAWH